jgi:Kef-type K+ transport system membrane component KefB
VATEALLLAVLVQLVVILAAARFFGALARRVRQPAVIGEILAGLTLGPSLFGAIWPEAFRAVFHPQDADVPKVMAVLAQIGLILLLFLVGLEFDFEHLKVRGGSALAIMLAGILIPFAVGAGLGPLIHPSLEAHPTKGPVPLEGLTLFLGTALCITALPVLGRILVELGIARTRLATVVIAAAAAGDALGWILLASVAALAQSAFSLRDTGFMIVLTIAFLAVMQFAVRPVALRYFRRVLDANDGALTPTALAALIFLLLLAAIATNLIGIFAIFGAFLLGAVLSDDERLAKAIRARIGDFTTIFFVPIFFTYTGLRTEIGAVGELWPIAIGVIAAGFAAKMIACASAARLTGFNARESLIVGGMMNTRGLMELIVINVGYDLGVIPKSLFCILVLMAVLSNLLTTPLILALRRGTELESPIEKSGFNAL